MILQGPALLLLLSKWTVSTLLLAPTGKASGQRQSGLTAITNAGSGRRLYAHYGAIDESGFGAAGPEGHVWKEQWWKFVETTCGQELPHAPTGGLPCYRIVNNDSGRSIYAESGKNWQKGVGATVGGETPKPDEKWFFAETECGPKDEKCYFIANAYSGRRLYASRPHSWEEGVGAVVNGEKIWEDQKWFIDIPVNDRDSEACLDFQSLDLHDCTLSNIRSTIQDALDALGGTCPHSVDEEIVYLTHLEDLSQAEYKLVNMCKGLGSCIDVWDDITINGCTYDDVVNKVDKVLPFHCDHDAETELRFFTSSETRAEMQQKIHKMCSEGWSNVDTSTFSDVNAGFDDEFMHRYVAGDTFLNEETGSFMGTAVGNSIDEFRQNEAESTVLQNFPSLENCEQQAIMCCFGRDRQPNDNNGNCANPLDKRCVNADPADNSNLCYTSHDEMPFPDETEGDIHCHGVAWAEDENDFTAQLRINNFFYVSLYDHMYTRGYVENTVDSPEVPMCSCIENMPPVSRSDCTQVDASLKFTIAFDEGKDTLVAIPRNDLYIEFNSCRGTNFANGRNQNNDLASYVHRLANERKISREIEGQVFETLVGYANPGDNENESACTESFKQNVGTEEDYSEGVVILGAHSGRRLYALDDKDRENGFGAAAPDAPRSEDQKWHFVPSACDGYPHARDADGLDLPCYEILNAHSGRRVYANKNGNFGDGAGAAEGYVYPSRKWVFQNASDCGEVDGGQRCVYVVNAFSGRRLYAVPGKEGGTGVGAVGEEVPKWDGQKWIIDIEDNYRTIPLAIE